MSGDVRRTRGALEDEARVRAAVAGAATASEALRNLGLRAAGGNYKTLRRACERFGLNYPAPTPEMKREQARRAREAQARPLSELLVRNSTASRGHLKKRLLAEGILENRCYTEDCNVAGTWLGQPLTLHLDHINGIPDDNRRSNLRLLCPNCHAQTDTYAGKTSWVAVPLAGPLRRRSRVWTDDDLRAALPASITWFGVAKKVGLAPTADAIARLQARCGALNLDVDHLHERPNYRRSPSPPAPKWSDDDLTAAVAACGSWRQVALMLGVSAAGKNYERLRARADLLGLDVSALRGRRAA